MRSYERRKKERCEYDADSPAVCMRKYNEVEVEKEVHVHVHACTHVPLCIGVNVNIAVCGLSAEVNMLQCTRGGTLLFMCAIVCSIRSRRALHKVMCPFMCVCVDVFG